MPLTTTVLLALFVLSLATIVLLVYGYEYEQHNRLLWQRTAWLLKGRFTGELQDGEYSCGRVLETVSVGPRVYWLRVVEMLVPERAEVVEPFYCLFRMYDEDSIGSTFIMRDGKIVTIRPKFVAVRERY